MKGKEKIVFSKLYWQISAIFLIVLVVFAATAIYIFVQSARDYSIEVNQKLNRNLAGNTVDIVKPFLEDGKVNQEAVEDLVHSMMVINPSIEIYLLDAVGNILSYVAPQKVVKLKKVSLQPVYEFLNDPEHNIIYGDDPRNPGEIKTFAAAEIVQEGKLTGFLYIVLASQEYVSTSDMVMGSYILGLSVKSIIAILIISALVGLLGLWFIVKKLNVITEGIREFQAGNLNKRIPVKNKDELDKIGLVFNEMAATIENNFKELQGIDELRKELIGNISHDLRTPIASIQGYAETMILKKDMLSTVEKEKYLETIYKSSEKLKKLVSDLFDLSKLQSNQVQLHKEPFSLSELVYDISREYRLISQKKGINIDTVVSKDIPVVKADVSQIERVLQNLIDNAIHICRKGDTIRINVSHKDLQQVQVRITDSGEGIDPEVLPHIFERYYKSSNHIHSTGLGLAIVKKIIDLHNTSIHVESIPGKGTSFFFSLPVAKVA